MIDINKEISKRRSNTDFNAASSRNPRQIYIVNSFKRSDSIE